MKHSKKWNSSYSTLFILSHLNIPHSTLSNRENLQFLIVKWTSSSYKQQLRSFSWAKKSLIPSNFPIFIQKPQNLWVSPPLDLSASPTILISQFCQFVSAHDSHKRYISDLWFKSIFLKKGTSLVTAELFQAWASALIYFAH